MKILSILLVATYLGVIAASSVAATPLSLSVSPPILEIVASAPDEIKAPLQITNDNDETVSFDIKLIPFVPKNNGSEVEFLNIELPIKKIVNIEDAGIPVNKITLNPLESRNLMLHLIIPKEQELNDYYFSIVFQGIVSEPKLPQTKEDELRAYSNISGGIATNVLLSLREKGEKQTKTEIIQFVSPKFIQNGPVTFNVRLKNEGKHFIKAGGTILITNMFGQQIGKLPLPAQNILAGSTRLYSPIIFPETFLLGPYAAELKLSPEAGGAYIKTTFYAFPIKKFSVALLVVAFILVTRKRVLRRLSR